MLARIGPQHLTKTYSLCSAKSLPTRHCMVRRGPNKHSHTSISSRNTIAHHPHGPRQVITTHRTSSRPQLRLRLGHPNGPPPSPSSHLPQNPGRPHPPNPPRSHSHHCPPNHSLALAPTIPPDPPRHTPSPRRAQLLVQRRLRHQLRQRPTQQLRVLPHPARLASPFVHHRRRPRG